MLYRAFVASTYEDLKEHRAVVIEALQAAGFAVDPMEHWGADSQAPREFSAARLKGCGLCILLVGFRRGHVPLGEQRSITQIEYDEARKRGIDVLPFLLGESKDAADAWPVAFDERQSDSRVDAWRAQLRATHGVSTFGAAPSSIHIEPALVRWVVHKEAARSRRRRTIGSIAVATLAAALLVVLLYGAAVLRNPALRSRYLSRLLALHDPVVFNSSSNGQYELARVLDSYTALGKDTRLSDEIKGTERSFDMLVNNAQYIRYAQKQNFMDIVKRGGHLRFIFWDYSEANRAAYDAFCAAIGQNVEETRGGARNLHAELRAMQATIAENKATYPGTLEYRWNCKPLLYTMWVRDWNQPNGLGHLSVNFYHGQEYFPSFRVSTIDGGLMLRNLHDEFEDAWLSSSPTLAGTP